MLISPEYQSEQRALHENNPAYGVMSVEYAPLVSQICDKLSIQHLLDYGAGKGRLFGALNVDHKMKLQAYDPGIEALSTPPVTAEMVACIDVLEHIEPACLDDVLDDLERLTKRVGIFTVCTCPAVKVLSDGRNAHLIQEPLEWWVPQLWERFDMQTVQVTSDNSFYVIVYARENRLAIPQSHISA